MTVRVVAVLGGGGAKAAAHLGVVDALRAAGIEPVHWIGVSMGAVMAAALAGGHDVHHVASAVKDIERHDAVRTDWLALARGVWAKSVLRPEPVRRLIEQLVGARNFSELGVPCSITAVEVETGAEVVFGAGGEEAPLIDVLAASCALPPYFPPVRLNGRECLDGGVRGTVPINVAASGTVACDVVLAVDTGPGFDEQGDTVDRPPRLIAAADTALGWAMAGTAELQRTLWERTPGLPKLVWLRPIADRGAMFAAERTARYIDAGRQAMERVLAQGELG